MLEKRIGLILIATMLSLMLVSQIPVAQAHSPGPITVDYDIGSETLTVTVTHSTADVNSHYVYEIVVEKNSVQVDIATYTSQSETTGVTETFSITAVEGDVLSATAKCSVSGQVTGQTTVTATETTETTTETTTSDSSTTTTTSAVGDSGMMTIVVAASILAIGVILVVVVLIKRK